jgi:hypothetical protein
MEVPTGPTGYRIEWFDKVSEKWVPLRGVKYVFDHKSSADSRVTSITIEEEAAFGDRARVFRSNETYEVRKTTWTTQFDLSSFNKYNHTATGAASMLASQSWVQPWTPAPYKLRHMVNYTAFIDPKSNAYKVKAVTVCGVDPVMAQVSDNGMYWDQPIAVLGSDMFCTGCVLDASDAGKK